MVKITGPLNGLEAHGTLRQQITFRRHARGAIVTQKQRRNHAIPSSLRVNAILVKFLQRWKNVAEYLIYLGWDTLAKQLDLTRDQAYIGFQIAQYKNNKAFHYDPFDEYVNPIPDPPEFGVYVRSGSTSPFIYPAAPPAFQYADLHRSENPDFTCNHDNLITILSPDIDDALYTDRYDLHGTYYYRARGWWIQGAAPSDESAPIEVTLP
jgi:hypothetical protein